MGAARRDAYPGKPNPSSVPDVWLMSMRGVTISPLDAGRAGRRQDLRMVLMS